MIEQKKSLEKLICIIESTGIPYAVCGSLSSSFHGQPRATNDADIIIAPTRDQLDMLLKSLEAGYYVSPEAASDAMKTCSMFNVIDNDLGWKADLIFRQDTPYQLSKFNRRRQVRLMGIDLWILSPEDVILSKLDWAKDSGSDLQFRDVFGVIKVQWDELDWDYLRHWAKELDVEENLEKVIEEVRKLRGEQ
jgi:hypothetical protein